MTAQHGIVEMPAEIPKYLLFEEFIVTDSLRVDGKKLIWKHNTGWVEITVGVLEEGNRIRALNPSITVATGNVLSLEEKFQGGTGVNITPPPEDYVAPLVIKRAKNRIEKVARMLGLQGYSRIDAFMHRESGELIIIEVNSLPGLTPATVIYHQALAERSPMYPVTFLEKIVQAGINRYGGAAKKRLKQDTKRSVLPLVS